MTLTVRESRIRPFSEANRASLVRRASRPHDLLRWFTEGFRAEVPERLTSYTARQGMHLASEFSSFMEDDATQDARLTDGTAVTEESYRFPMRTALRALAGRGTIDEPYPFMAQLLFRVACTGDVDTACDTMGIVRPVRRPYVMTALERLYERYLDVPSPRLVRGW